MKDKDLSLGLQMSLLQRRTVLTLSTTTEGGVLDLFNDIVADSVGSMLRVHNSINGDNMNISRELEFSVDYRGGSISYALKIDVCGADMFMKIAHDIIKTSVSEVLSHIGDSDKNFMSDNLYKKLFLVDGVKHGNLIGYSRICDKQINDNRLLDFKIVIS
ncbi:MAG: hypothetical protein ACRCZ9_08930 [Fusobacteriaceae bacterium]